MSDSGPHSTDPLLSFLNRVSERDPRAAALFAADQGMIIDLEPLVMEWIRRDLSDAALRDEALKLMSKFLDKMVAYEKTAPDGFCEQRKQMLIDYLAIRVRAIVEKLVEMATPVRTTTTPVDFVANAVVSELKVMVDREYAKGSSLPPEYHVTLLQMAGIVHKGKRTLERLKSTGVLPPPAVKGEAGTADEWKWSVVRPILEKRYNRKLPEVFPADRFAETK